MFCRVTDVFAETEPVAAAGWLWQGVFGIVRLRRIGVWQGAQPCAGMPTAVLLLLLQVDRGDLFVTLARTIHEDRWGARVLLHVLAYAVLVAFSVKQKQR
jgi:hypothetical protein